MNVEFQRVSFKNFLSYGNKVTVFELQRGLNLITGSNGCGKSVILDVLSFSLFGQPYRKIKISELVNRRNKKQLFVEVFFKIDGVEYKIERGLNPAKLNVFKDGEALDLLSAKKLTQDELNKILGIDHELFRQIISLAISYNKPFLSMPMGEKRTILENIFGIAIFGEMLKTLKKNNSGSKTQTEINIKTIELLEATIRGLNKQIKDSKLAENDFIKNKNADIKNIQTKIDKITAEMKSLTDKINKNNEKIIPIDEDELSKKNKQLLHLSVDMGNLKFEVAKFAKDKQYLRLNTHCTHCHQSISEEHKLKEFSMIDEAITKLIILGEDVEKQIKETKVIIDNIVDQKNLNEELTSANQEMNSRIEFYRQEKDSLLYDIETIETRKINFNFDSMEKNLKSKSEEYVDVFKQHDELVKKTKLNDKLSEILSEEGVKAFFFKKLIPLLNSKVNEVLNTFDLPLQITFNEMMEEEIHNYSNGNDVVNYFSLSEGEKKRIDIAILIAFINITKIINNWRCNLILMDELLDSSVDGEGLDKMIECLKNYSNKMKERSCVYLISHRAMDNNFFDNIYTVRKNHGFSEIELKNS